MTYEEIVAYVQKKAAKADVKGVENVAVQIDITGEGHGAFYVAVMGGKIDVQPYEYNDRDAKVVAEADKLIAFLDGKGDESAFTVEGDAAKALVLKKLVAKTAAKKAEPAKKAAPKKK